MNSSCSQIMIAQYAIFIVEGLEGKNANEKHYLHISLSWKEARQRVQKSNFWIVVAVVNGASTVIKTICLQKAAIVSLTWKVFVMFLFEKEFVNSLQKISVNPSHLFGTNKLHFTFDWEGCPDNVEFCNNSWYGMNSLQMN